MKRVVTLLRESAQSVGWDRVSTRLGIALLVVSAFFFAANFADKAWLSYQVKQERQLRLAEISDVRRQIAHYKHDLAFLQSRSYYVEAARTYGYVQPGDTPLSLTQEAAPAAAPGRELSQTVTVPPARHESLLHRLLQAIVPGL